LKEAEGFVGSFDELNSYVSSFPPLRLLMNIQKDLLIRAAQSVNVADILIQALVAYAKMVFNSYTHLIESSWNKDPQVMRAGLERIRQSVLGALMPTLTNSLFLFSHHIWLAKELLPSIVELVLVVDKANFRLPPIPSVKLYYVQKRNEFVEGPSRTTETTHPYSVTQSHQAITIPGVVFISLVFDERSSTAGPSDFLQLYRDHDRTQPIGERYYGDRSRWPKHRILVPGDTVVFSFHAETESTAWGYRCTLIGHMPNSDQDSIPLSVHLEKTLCSLGKELYIFFVLVLFLGGQFAGLLISGLESSESEQTFGITEESDLLYGGFEERLAPSLFANCYNQFDMLQSDLGYQ
jgi:hypothetical protein